MTRPFLYCLNSHNVGLNNNKPTAVQKRVPFVSFLNLETDDDKINNSPGTRARHVHTHTHTQTHTDTLKQTILSWNCKNIIWHNTHLSAILIYTRVAFLVHSHKQRFVYIRANYITETLYTFLCLI